MSQTSGTKKNHLWRWLPGVLISMVAAYAVFRFTNLENLGEAFHEVKISFVIILAGMLTISLLTRAVAWRILLGKKVNLVTSFFGVCTGYFLNNILPLRAGEVGRAVFVGKSSKLGTFHLLSTIFIERAFDLAFASSLVLLTLPLIIGADWLKPIAITAIVLILTGIILLTVLARKKDQFLLWFEHLKIKSPFIKEKIVPQIRKMINGLEALTNPFQFGLSLFWIAITWTIWVTTYYFVLFQMQPQAELIIGAFIAGIFALGVSIPSAPAALGVYEATLVGAFALLGISTNNGLAYALVLHGTQFVIVGIFGIWGLFREGHHISSFFDSIKQQSDNQMEA